MSTLTDRTDAVAAGPASAGNRSENATQQSLLDLIELEKHRAASSLVQSPAAFLQGMTLKLVPPGAS